MRAAVVLCALAAAPCLSLASVSYEAQFASWKATWARSYPSHDEEALRLAVFSANVDAVAAHNARGLPWSMAINAFGDLTAREFAASHIGGYRPRGLRGDAGDDVAGVPRPPVDLPNEVDWTKRGVVTPPKTQGECGACWAFAAVSTTESINAINGHGLITLSNQQLIDCAGSFGNEGCNGGTINGGYRYIIANGACTEKEYPYTGQDGTCKPCKPAVKLSGYVNIKKSDDLAMATAIAQQPVAVVLEADQSTFQFYSSGVMTGPCGTSLDHEIMAVGYGSLAGIDYFRLQNEWGTNWGMDGYVLLARNQSYNNGAGQCGIYLLGSYPVQ